MNGLLLGDCTKDLNSLWVIHKIDTMPLQEFVCPACGKVFSKYQQKKPQATYCSQACAYRGRTLGFTKRRITKPYVIKVSQKKRVGRICEICGEKFETVPSKIAKGKSKYCCRKCFELSHKTRMKGENNPSYIDGRSKNKRCYRCDDWETLRKKVYARDGWLCQVCGKRCEGRDIQAHHVIPFRISHDNSMENLVTVCLRCHAWLDNGKEVVVSKNQ